jgi:hypothetical protein
LLFTAAYAKGSQSLKKRYLEQQNSILRSKLAQGGLLALNPASVQSLPAQRSTITESAIHNADHMDMKYEPASIISVPVNDENEVFLASDSVYTTHATTSNPPQSHHRTTDAPAVESTTVKSHSLPKVNSMHADIPIQPPAIERNSDTGIIEPACSSLPINYVIPFQYDYQIKRSNMKLVHDMSVLNRNITTMISDNSTSLNTLPRAPVVAVTPSAEKSSKEDSRQRIQNLLKQLNDVKAQHNEMDDMFDLMPLWRHRLRYPGIEKEDIPPHKVLSGVRLLRIIVHGIRVIHCEPLIRAKKRKLNFKPKEIHDWQRTMMVFMDACSSWIGKLVRVPIQSIEQV